MNRSYLVVIILINILIAVLFGALFYNSRNQNCLQSTLERLITLEQQIEENKTKRIVEVTQERVVSVAQVWRPIQEKVHNTVVQIYVHNAELDLLQPYKTPTQGAATGSGFFINAEGYLITNAHVVINAKAVWAQMSGLGKQILDVEVIGISPDRDLALLRIMPESLELIKEQLGQVPFLPLGDSDTVLRSDEVLALGYPLGQDSLKSTSGVISGRQGSYLQISAAINPGNSGGPLLNCRGEVIGINNAIILGAQNVGYAIPVNDLKLIVPDLHIIKILRKPYLGIIFSKGSRAMTDYLGNPQPGGCYVAGVVKDSTLDKAGVQKGDMLYEINGYKVDIFAEMSVSWSEDKISIIDFVGHLSPGQEVRVVVYRKGTRKEFSFTFDIVNLPAIHAVYPAYELIDYEVFGGLVVMPLTINHIQQLMKDATGLGAYAEIKNQNTPALIITHVLPNSQAYRSRSLLPGMILYEVNGMKVSTLEEFRQAIRKDISKKYLTILASDTITRSSDHLLVVLEYEKIINEESQFAADYKYSLSTIMQDVLITKQLAANMQKTPSLLNKIGL
jgi:serine protease Do